ncbi:MAG: heat-inducible transcriptional repressor HrcA [Alphaproteobacteria bacterium]
MVTSKPRPEPTPGPASTTGRAPSAPFVQGGLISELNERSRDVFRQVVDAYLETGDPIGSQAIAARLASPLSSATIRNTMAELQEAGLLYAPHTSAGRLPTERGLRLFVDGLMEVGSLGKEERASIESECAARGMQTEQVLRHATGILSQLSHCAGLVLAPKAEKPLRQIDFVSLGPGEALVVMVFQNGLVENRVINTPKGMPAAALVEAGNYLSSRLAGRTLSEARDVILDEIAEERAHLDKLTAAVVQEGLAMRTGDDDDSYLIVRGQSHLLSDIHAVDQLERIRDLFEVLETKRDFVTLLDETHRGDGVQIFIGSENPLFQNAGCSMIVAPFSQGNENLVGAIGVIGPTRLNYSRIIPMVDFTAKVVNKVMGN